MDAMSRGIGFVREAESSLQRLIGELATRQQYAELGELAKLAEAVTILLGRFQPARPGGRHIRDSRVPRVVHLKDAATPTVAVVYPYFERGGERLIKVGWSKSDGAVYEHRAPLSTVMAVRATLQELGKGGKVVAADRLLPLHIDGDEIPSYQVYLVLAWLRGCDAIRACGKTGYAVVGNRLEPSAVQDFWSSLKDRSVPEEAKS